MGGAQGNINALLDEAERLIRLGAIKEAAAQLDQVAPSSLSRGQCLEMSRLLRRVGLSERSLALMAPLVRARKVYKEPATPSEKAEYAICLQRVGSLKEAERLLEEVDPAGVPEALLYKAICFFSVWNYAAAVPLLEQLSKHPAAGDYLQQACRLNLAAALVIVGRLDEAESLLQKILESTEDQQYLLLKCNAYEVQAQLMIDLHQYESAEKSLQAAEKILSGIKTVDRLWLFKWRGIAEALRTGELQPLTTATDDAVRKHHWETVRDLDFYRLKVKFDNNTFIRLFFGTRSPHYRERLLTAFPMARLPDQVLVGADWHLVESAKGAVDPYSLSGDLAPGTVIHALFMLFTGDWYKSFRSGEVFATLFNDEYFNPNVSANRVHRGISRLRKALAEQIPCLDLVADGGSYRLHMRESATPLIIRRNLVPVHPGRLRLEQFHLRFGKEKFDRDDLREVLTLSRAGANKLLANWRDQELITPVTKGKLPKYKRL